MQQCTAPEGFPVVCALRLLRFSGWKWSECRCADRGGGLQFILTLFVSPCFVSVLIFYVLLLETCFKGHDRCLTASACCSSADVKVFVSFPSMLKISDAFIALECLVTDETFYCCWDMVPIRTFSGKKNKNCIRIAKIRRWDQTLNFCFHPASSVPVSIFSACFEAFISFKFIFLIFNVL